MSARKNSDERAIETDVRLEIGARVLARRSALGLTQAQVGERAHLPESTVMRLETGHSSASVVLLLRIAAALECQVADFMPTIERFQNIEARRRAD